ncbi:MAG: ABC transporter permease [Cyclobacteriaceae bacterium]
MNYRENIREGIKSIVSNKLRTVLTAIIIAIGITSLVGILTAIDGIRSSIGDSFSSLGSNTFYISDKRAEQSKSQGVTEKKYPPITYDQARMFLAQYKGEGIGTVNSTITWNAEVKRKSKVSNPNIRVTCGNINYLRVEGYNLDAGRNFSAFEEQNGANVAIIGQEVLKSLYLDNENPLNTTVSFLGNKFKVIGVLEEQGNSGNNGSADRYIMVPLETGRRISQGRSLRYQIGIVVNDPSKIDLTMGEATGLMKAVRKDLPGSDHSFDIKKRQSLAERLEEITTYLRIGGFTIGFITLLGASIGLMNIMLVSVTERTREIGVRKALGATPKKIRQQFLIEAIVITQLGGAAGILLGIVIGNVISVLLNPGTYVIPWLWILFGFGIGVVVGLLSGYIPAHKASKLDPIESLRFE